MAAPEEQGPLARTRVDPLQAPQEDLPPLPVPRQGAAEGLALGQETTLGLPLPRQRALLLRPLRPSLDVPRC